jgi:hypothetical protein
MSNQHLLFIDAESGQQTLGDDDATRYLFGNDSDNNDSSGSNRYHYD